VLPPGDRIWLLIYPDFFAPKAAAAKCKLLFFKQALDNFQSIKIQLCLLQQKNSFENAAV
jgi:hypothetical protein